jgi:hypothetical protein
MKEAKPEKPLENLQSKKWKCGWGSFSEILSFHANA